MTPGMYTIRLSMTFIHARVLLELRVLSTRILYVGPYIIHRRASPKSNSPNYYQSSSLNFSTQWPFGTCFGSWKKETLVLYRYPICTPILWLGPKGQELLTSHGTKGQERNGKIRGELRIENKRWRLVIKSSNIESLYHAMALYYRKFINKKSAAKATDNYA